MTPPTRSQCIISLQVHQVQSTIIYALPFSSFFKSIKNNLSYLSAYSGITCKWFLKIQLKYIDQKMKNVQEYNANYWYPRVNRRKKSGGFLLKTDWSLLLAKIVFHSFFTADHAHRVLAHPAPKKIHQDPLSYLLLSYKGWDRYSVEQGHSYRGQIIGFKLALFHVELQ